MTISTKDINAFLLQAARDGVIDRGMGAAILKQVNAKRRRTDIAIVGNLYAHNRDRNPLFKGGARGAVVNNYIYNPGGRAMHYALVPSEWGERPYATGQMVVVGNVLGPGPSTRRPMSLLRHHRGGPCEVYLADNLAIGQADDVPLLEIDSRAAPGECRVLDVRPFWSPELVALPAVEAACAEALADGVHSADVVLNILARSRDPGPPATIMTPDALRLACEPIADCARYDSLRRAV